MSNINVIPVPLKTAMKVGEFILPESASLVKFVKKKIDKSVEGDEAYRLEVTPEGIKIAASCERGLFMGWQTAKQLAMTANGTTTSPGGVSLPCLETEDRPRFAYRGFMIDSSRHMQAVDELKTMIRAAAFFKFNVFHWHICDDQGFRFESGKYPLLNTVGSWRDGSHFGKIKSAERYGGFYTKDEMREIVDFCGRHYIDVIPEIEMPGHVSAVLASYPEFLCANGNNAADNNITSDKIDVKILPGIFSDILCAGKEGVYEFVCGLLDEVMEVFPSKYIHLGGDEAPKKNWRACPNCQSRIKENSLADEEELQAYFINRVSGYLKSRGKTALTWNESLKSGKLDTEVITQMWMDKEDLCANRANGGGNIIISDFFAYYADYPYAMTPLNKTYRHEPIPKKVKKENHGNILGVETPIWTEYVDNFDKMAYQCYPRFAAAAESAWSEPKNKNADDFIKRMKKITPILKKTGVNPALAGEWNPLPHQRASGMIKFAAKNYSLDFAKEFIKMAKENKK
ncbi:MAG: beta-N-acetylhexosaminidase [Oscillospiraceae bacterium]|nr:beta-N-acetylhexosaminidase [Oscillospiraceae bacterium]